MREGDMADPPAAPRAGAMGPPAVGGAGEAFARGAAATAAAAAAAAAAAGKGGSSGRAGEDEAEEESRRRKKRQREDQGGGGDGGGAFAAAQETQRRKDDGCSEEDGDEGSLRKRCRSVACGAKPYVEARARAGPERAEHNGWMGRAPPLHQGITTQRGGGPAEAAAAVPAAAQPAESKSSAPDNPELRRPARVKGPPGGGGGDGGRPRGRLGASSFTQPPGGAAPAPAGRRLPARMHCVRDAHTPSGRGCHNALSRAVTRVCQKAGFTGGTAFAIDELAKVTELYLVNLMSAARAYAEVAGRSRPCPLDLMRVFQEFGVRTGQLEMEMERYRVHDGGTAPPQILDNQLSATCSETTARLPTIGDDRAEVAAKALIPEYASPIRPEYVLEHMPPFPARYTYEETAVFDAWHVDPVFVRLKHAEQSRLAENSLKQLLALEASRGAAPCLPVDPSPVLAVQPLPAAGSELTCPPLRSSEASAFSSRPAETTALAASAAAESSRGGATASGPPPALSAAARLEEDQLQLQRQIRSLLTTTVALVANYETKKQADFWNGRRPPTANTSPHAASAAASSTQLAAFSPHPSRFSNGL